MMRRVTYLAFQREDVMVRAFFKQISENHLGVIVKQYGNDVIVQMSGVFSGHKSY